MKKALVITQIICLLCGGLLAQPNTNEKLITDFHQSDVAPYQQAFKQCFNPDGAGNCATIALIKTALGQFKTLNIIYKSYEHKNDGTYHFVFNDNFAVDLTQSEVDLAGSLAGIVSSPDSVYFKEAIAMYASICKRFLTERHSYVKNDTTCTHSFRDAIDRINSGFPSKDAYMLLGMHKKKVGVLHLRSTPAALIYDPYHAAFCTMGIQDKLGKPYKVRGGWMLNPKGAGSFISHAYILVK